MSDAGPDDELDESRMTVLEHLQELRKRLRNAGIVLVAAGLVSSYYAMAFFQFLARPVERALIQLGQPAVIAGRFNRYALVLAVVAGAILTPGTDVYSQLLLAGPLYLLYNLSIAIVWVIERRGRTADELESPLLLLLAAWPAIRRGRSLALGR
jgi:Sec-independent protein secretion pathway component TatC